MACYRPLSAWQTESGEIVFAERGKILRSLVLPCGQCIGCRLARSRGWAIRCMHEQQCHEWSSFVTLTYNEESVPYPPSLDVRPFQLFMKRLRKRMRVPIRYYMCGEYGESFGRPHYHACLFGVFFEDREVWKDLPSGFKLYRSKVLEELWPLGNSSVGDVTYESARYVANYCTKKVNGPRAHEHYQWIDPYTGEVFERDPEFACMSLKPGIGQKWFERYSKEVFVHDAVIVDGMKIKPPRYYDTLIQRMVGENYYKYDEIQFQRYKDSLKFEDDYSYDRLRAREVVTRARLAFNKRTLE